MFLSIATPTLSNTDAAQSNNSLFFIIGGIVLAAILIGVGIWFFTQPKDAVAPAGWTQDPAKDLATVVASLNDQRAHAYITKAYVGTKSIIKKDDIAALEGDLAKTYADVKRLKSWVLIYTLAYEEFNKSIGTKDAKLFSDWKAKILTVSAIDDLDLDSVSAFGGFIDKAIELSKK